MTLIERIPLTLRRTQPIDKSVKDIWALFARCPNLLYLRVCVKLVEMGVADLELYFLLICR